jgi:hypothetical protein
MDGWKTFFASRTVWANGVGLAALILNGLGFDGGAIEQEAAVEALLEMTAGLAFLASTLFRVVATRKLTV